MGRAKKDRSKGKQERRDEEAKRYSDAVKANIDDIMKTGSEVLARATELSARELRRVACVFCRSGDLVRHNSADYWRCDACAKYFVATGAFDSDDPAMLETYRRLHDDLQCAMLRLDGFADLEPGEYYFAGSLINDKSRRLFRTAYKEPTLVEEKINDWDKLASRLRDCIDKLKLAICDFDGRDFKTKPPSSTTSQKPTCDFCGGDDVRHNSDNYWYCIACDKAFTFGAAPKTPRMVSLEAAKASFREAVVNISDARLRKWISGIKIVQYLTFDGALYTYDKREFLAIRENFDRHGPEHTSGKLARRRCDVCEKTTSIRARAFLVCARCLRPHYCSERCQKRHWDDVHKTECTARDG
mmetsp:Transcript_20065/g.61811  ORF Transcript_20065/g.61811 Transcript_20065/m.61811 type:complete len:357 (+) Transcript_20065:36-1106(+)